MRSRFIKDSVTTMTEIVLPNDANPLGYLRGGRLMDWMDIASEITAQKHSGYLAVTASVDKVTFDNPIKVGDIVTIQATITRTFSTSMEIMVQVWAENIPEGKAYKANDAYFIFVAIDKEAKPVTIPQAVPVSALEVHHYEEALKRRSHRKEINKKKKNIA